MKRVLITVVLLMSMFPLFGWTAYQNNPRGMLDNPAYLGWTNESEFMAYTIDGEDLEYKENHGFITNMNGLGFGYERLGGATNWHLGLGINDPNRKFYMGYAYQWNKMSGHTERGWRFGVMVQPTVWSSLGWNYDHPVYSDDDYHSVGLALRPMGKYLTLFGDAEWRINGDFEDVVYNAGAEINLKGIRIYGDYEYDVQTEEDRINIGARIDINPHMGVGIEAPTDSDFEINSGTAFVHSSLRKFPTIFPGGPKKVLKMTFSGSYSEKQQYGFFGTTSGRPFINLIDDIEKAGKSKDIESIVIYWKNPSLSFAQAYELHEALSKVKHDVYFYAHGLSNLGYYVGTAADKIILDHGGMMVINGLSASVDYYKKPMDKIGVQMEVIKAGAYKDPGTFTDTTMSETVREEFELWFDTFFNEFLTRLSVRTGSKEKAEEIVNNAPYTSKEAKELGLIDTILYRDELDEYAKGMKINPGGLEALSMRNTDFSGGEKIAIIFAEGNIVSGNGGGGGIFNNSNKLGAYDIERAVKNVLSDNSVKAVVLRINSPGGSAQASEDMWHQLNKINEKEIPIIASMGGVAASGGYYISTAAEKVFADPTTITGSIGVIAMKPSIAGLKKKVGINTVKIERGENAGMWALGDTLSTKEKDRLKESIAETYMIFKKRVADGRGMTMDEVEEIAQGRIWTGKDALGVGLVDTLGSFRDAIEYAAELAELKDYSVRTYNSGFSSMDLFSNFAEMKAPSLESVLRNSNSILGQEIAIPDFPFTEYEPLFYMPCKINVE